MEKKIISTNNAPAAVGPYSQAVQYNGVIYVSGQLPIDPATGEMPADIKAQSEQSLKNIKSIVEAAGATMDDALKLTVFLKDINDFGAMNEVYATFFTEGSYPARCAYEVVNLPKGALVEIDAIVKAD